MSIQLARGPRAAAGTAPSSTRQQLDELDALLARMLELPVQPGDDEPEAEPRRADPPREAPRPPAARMEMRPEEPQAPVTPSPTRPPQSEVAASPRVPGQRSYPASYMVVESSTPAYLTQPPLSGQRTSDPRLGPRIVSAEEAPVGRDPVEMPVPGGRHDLEANEPIDPAGDLARLQAELGAAPEEWVPFHSSWQPSEQTWKPLAESWQQAKGNPTTAPPAQPEAAKAPPPVFPASDTRPKLRDLPRASMPPPPVAAPSVSPPPPSQAPSTPAPTVSSPSLFALPLVWFNAAFDVVLIPLGPAGQWFKSKSGGGFLALMGLLFLAGAAGVAAADLCGWTW